MRETFIIDKVAVQSTIEGFFEAITEDKENKELYELVGDGSILEVNYDGIPIGMIHVLNERKEEGVRLTLEYKQMQTYV